MRKDMLITSTIALIISLFYSFGDILYLFVSLMILIIVLRLIFLIKNYNHKKIYYIFPFPIMVLQGLVLTYTFLFRSEYLKDPLYSFIFYSFLMLFIGYVIFYTFYIKKEYSKIL